MRRLTLFALVAGAFLAPATPAFAHAGDAPIATVYRTTVTGISTPEKGLSVRTVEAGARLELTNHTGHPVEILGYSGEPYLDVRPDGTYQNVNSPAAYLNETLAGDNPAPATADPTAIPSWRRVSTTTTVRWHDQRTHWLSPGVPPAAKNDPSRTHRLRDWSVPLREQARTFAITGTLDWIPSPRVALWWLGAGLLGLAAVPLARRWPGLVRPLALLAGAAPIAYALSRAADGGSPPPVLFPVGFLALAAVWRHPPFYLALTGLVVFVFGGLTIGFDGAVLPTAGPAWAARLLVLLSAGLGITLAVTGVLRLRPPAAPPALSSSA
ncbi:hypothetical protein [Actinoplanes sp. NPDC051411]|uniref:hypothetical protein n=1 Tax=Actinoplanes sp. NPDC051411 TaxID=3155522 RepID=UPI003440DB30